MSLIVVFIISLCLTLNATEPQFKTVKFIVKAENLSPQEKVYITGNQPELANWNPGKIVLKKQNNGLYTRTFKFPIGTHLEYKFTLGTWEKEARDSIGRPFPNFVLDVNSDTVIQYTIKYWSKPEIPTRLTIKGNFVLHHFESYKGLLKRDIIVWLPPDYYENQNKSYPVLYMHDGQNLFDPALSAFGIEWQVDETVDSLVAKRLISPIIVVGIFNTKERRDEYGNTKKGKIYREFIVKKVKPYIDANYRTLPDRENTATGGSSMGGLVSFILIWEYPEVFSKAICMSPAFKIRDIDYVSVVKNTTQLPQNIKIYIDNGGLDLEAQLQPGIDEMLEALKAKGYKEGSDFLWIKDKNASHNEAAWAKRLPQALQFIFPKQE